MELYPDQIKSKQLLAESIKRGNKRIVFGAPTGFGKTVVMGNLTKGAINKGNRVWIIVDNIELINQTRETLGQFGIDTAVIQGFHEDTDYSKQVQVVTAQTITRRWRIFDMHPQWLPDFVLVDEIHCQYKATTELMNMLPNVIIIGMSATPTSKGLGLNYDDLIVPSTTKQLISEDRLVKTVTYSCLTPDMTGVKTGANGDWAENETEKRVNTVKLRGKLVENWVKLAQNRKTIIFCVNVQHANDVCNEFYDNGIATAEINGRTHKELRKQIIEDFKNDEYQVLVSVGVLIKGFDDKTVGCICACRPTKSLSLWIQQIGRGLRQNDRYDDCIVLDFAGNTERLGFAEDYNPESHGLCDGKKGNSTDRKPKEEPLPMTCPKCNKIAEIGTVRCSCGYEFKKKARVENDDSELKELKKKLTPAEKRNKDFNTEEKEYFYAGLTLHAHHKNYKNGWAENKYKEYFSVWPNKIKKVPIVFIPEPVKKFITAGNIRYASRRK